jgi:hypothetical protein
MRASCRLGWLRSFAWSAAAVEDAHELAGYCQSLEHGAKGAGRHIYIPRSRDGCECERPCSDPSPWACAPLNGVDKFADGIIAKRIIELGKAGERNRDLLC